MDNGYRIFILESREAVDEQLRLAAYEAAPLYVEHVSENGGRNVWFYLSWDGITPYTKPGELALISKLL